MPNNWLLTERQKQIDRWLRGAVNFYGSLPHRAFLVLYNKYNRPKLLKAELLQYSNKLMRQPDRNYRIYENVIINLRVSDEIIDRAIYYQKGKSFYYPPAEELLKYVDNDYYERTEQTQRLSKFLRGELKMNVLSTEAFVRKLAWLHRIDEPVQKQVALFEEHRIIPKDLNQANEFFGLIADSSNNTRKWTNCGFTPQEIYTQSRK